MSVKNDIHPTQAFLFGTYSPWPRHTSNRRRKLAAVLGGAGSIGVFLHCVLPMLIGV